MEAEDDVKSLHSETEEDIAFVRKELDYLESLTYGEDVKEKRQTIPKNSNKSPFAFLERYATNNKRKD